MEQYKHFEKKSKFLNTFDIINDNKKLEMIDKEIFEKKFEKNGYLIFDDKSGQINILRKKIVNKIKSLNNKIKKLPDDRVLNEFHKYFSKKMLMG